MVDVTIVDPRTPEGAFVASGAVTAADFIGGFKWGSRFGGMSFGCAIMGVAGAYLVDLRAPVGPDRDDRLWIVVGAGPCSYLVTDQVRQPSDALAVHARLVDDWLADAERSGRGSDVFPFAWSRTNDALVRLRSINEDIKRAIARSEHDRRSDSTWIDAEKCPRRIVAAQGDRSFSDDTISSSVGMMARDHLGCLGLVIAPVPCPPKDWLTLQRDARFAARAHEAWIKIMCSSGGSMWVPFSLTTVVGPPTAEQVAELLRNANEFGRREIKSVLKIE